MPFDPPRRLVTTGLYAYVRNPMQLSAVMFLSLLGLLVNNLWLAAAGVMAHVYSAGLAGWNENGDLERRFGGDWVEYRKSVRTWLPRIHPWQPPSQPHARLFVSHSCPMCREVGTWFERRTPRYLVIIRAESHPSPLTRITYEPSDGSGAAHGVEAIARALEHVHLGWALVGCTLRLPGIRDTAQLLIDASGGEPRALDQSCNWPT